MAPAPESPWRPAYVGIGSNLDDPRRQVDAAFERLAKLRDTRLELRSRIYLSRPLGPQDQPDFVNAVAGLLTRLTARTMLDGLLGIERSMGRNRHERWGPRLIDLDLLWMHGASIDEAGLTLPHPGVTARNFVLYPLLDIAPTLIIAGHGSVAQLKSRMDGGGIHVLE